MTNPTQPPTEVRRLELQEYNRLCEKMPGKGSGGPPKDGNEAAYFCGVAYVLDTLRKGWVKE